MYWFKDIAIERYRNGRALVDMATWGGGLSVREHYVVLDVLPQKAREITGLLRQLGFRPLRDYYITDWLGLPEDMDIDGLAVGRWSYFGKGLRLSQVQSIGRFTSIAATAQALGNHPLNMMGTGVMWQAFSPERYEMWKRRGDEAAGGTGGKVAIGNDVWIGHNAFINTSRCAVIGDGAIIGAGAFVNRDVPPCAVVYGSPARVRRYRFTPEEVEIYLRVKWWEWDDDRIDRDGELLIYPERFFERFGL